MEKPFIEAPPNVVSETGLRKNLENGWTIEIVSRSDSEKRNQIWYGNWVIRGISPDGRRVQQLVTVRNNLEFRVFKTANAVISFMSEMGFDHVSIPLREGRRCLNRLEGE